MRAYTAVPAFAVPPPLPYLPLRPRRHDARHEACTQPACAARAAGVHATVADSPDALIVFTGDVSLPNLRLTGCNAGADGAVLSFSGGAVRLTGARVDTNNADTGERRAPSDRHRVWMSKSAFASCAWVCVLSRLRSRCGSGPVKCRRHVNAHDN